MLASSINITSIDTLLVTFRYTKNTSLNKHYRQDINYEIRSMQLHVKRNSDSFRLVRLLFHLTSNINDINIVKYFVTYLLKKYIEDIKYEIRQLHIQDRHTHDIPTLLAELKHIIYTKYMYIYNATKIYDIIYELQYILSMLNLPITVSNSATQTANIHIQKLFSFIRNIANASYLHTPKHIYYRFTKVSFMDDKIMNTLIDTISSDATYVRLYGCYFTTQFITTLVTSLSKLVYLGIDDYNLQYLRSQHKDPTINALSFQKLKESKLKGLYLSNVTLQDDLLLYEYLQSQSTLQEIYLHRTTDSTLDTLHAIQHLTSLHYFYIINSHHYSLEKNEDMSAYLANLYKNRHTLSYFNFNITTERYTDILPTLSQCHNLQYINLFNCCLTPLHMPALATTINQLPALLYIDMNYSSYITDEAIITLTAALTTHKTVIWINLSYCNLSSAPAIISLVNKFPSLQMIDLGYNELDYKYKFNDTSKEELKTFTKLRKIYLTI